MELYLMNADGSNQVRLTNNQSAEVKHSWSPDGSKIAFTTKRDGNGEIYVMNADGSNPINITNSPALDGEPSWSPFLMDEAAEAIEAIKRLGGRVTIDQAHPDKPVVGVQFGRGGRDRDLVLLKSLPKLRVLNLEAAGITDVGMGIINGLTELTSLNVARTEITDVGLAHLTDLTKLKRV